MKSTPREQLMRPEIKTLVKAVVTLQKLVPLQK
jgi:hypothetical protein